MRRYLFDRLRLSACLLFCAVISATVLAQDTEKELIAVLDLRGVKADEPEVAALTDRLREVLLKTGRYTLVDRSQMEAILDEQALQQTVCTEQECAVQVGRILGVRKIVASKVVKVSDTVWLLSAIMVDVETAETVRAESVQHRGDFFALMTRQVAALGARLAGPRQPAGRKIAGRPVADAPAVHHGDHRPQVAPVAHRFQHVLPHREPLEALIDQTQRPVFNGQCCFQKRCGDLFQHRG